MVAASQPPDPATVPSGPPRPARTRLQRMRDYRLLLVLLLLLWAALSGRRAPVIAAFALLWIFATPLTGVLIWGGLYLRDPRLRLRQRSSDRLRKPRQAANLHQFLPLAALLR